MSYGEYSYYKSQTRMPSYEQYVYDKSVGRPVYNTYGPLQAVTGHYVTAYPRTPSYTVFTSPGISAPVEQMEYYCDVANRVPDIQALGAGNYEGISKAVDMTPSFFNGLFTGFGKNLSTIAVYISAAFEELITGDSRSASRAISNISTNTELRRSSSKYPAIFDFGVILGDLLPSIFVGGGAGKAASETVKATVTVKNGTSLIIAADSVLGLETAVELIAISGALVSAADLGNYLSSLIVQVKSSRGSSSSKHLTMQEMNQQKSKVLQGKDVQFDTKEQALEFIERKFPDFKEEIAGARSAEGWHFDAHKIGDSDEIIEHINIYSKKQNFRVHITWG